LNGSVALFRARGFLLSMEVDPVIAGLAPAIHLPETTLHYLMDARVIGER